MTMEELMSRLSDLENRLSSLEQERSPESMYSKLAFFVSTLEEQAVKISEHDAKFAALDGDLSMDEMFTDQELHKWYNASGLMFKDVQAFIGATVEQTNQFFAGKHGDDHLRSKAGKWMRQRAVKNISERNG